MASLRPFVFRRYVDFGVIESLRGMKQMITTEVRRRGLQDNVKLGHGGIREVEFIAQCFQLIRGGRDLGLQQRELLAGAGGVRRAGLPAAPAVARAARRLPVPARQRARHPGLSGQADPGPARRRLAAQAMATVMGFASWEIIWQPWTSTGAGGRAFQ